MLAQGRSFTSSDEEYKTFEAQLLHYIENEAQSAQKTVMEELKQDPLYYYKTFTEQRWNKNIDNYFDSTCYRSHLVCTPSRNSVLFS